MELVQIRSKPEKPEGSEYVLAACRQESPVLSGQEVPNFVRNEPGLRKFSKICPDTISGQFSADLCPEGIYAFFHTNLSGFTKKCHFGAFSVARQRDTYVDKLFLVGFLEYDGSVVRDDQLRFEAKVIP